jgi:hypothetical protein
MQLAIDETSLIEPILGGRTQALKVSFNNNNLEHKHLVLPALIKGLSLTLHSLELKFYGGIFKRHVDVIFPQSKIDTLIINEHYTDPNDDPVLRPSIFSLAQSIIEPNDFKLKTLQIECYRRNLAVVNTFLQTLYRQSLKTLQITIMGACEKDEAYQAANEVFYETLGRFYMLKHLKIDD